MPGQFDLRRNSITRFGCFSALRGLCSLDDAQLLKPEPVGITLEQLADGSGPKHAILTGLVPAGEEPTLVVYGTLWCCKVTHYAAEVLTRRGKLELPLHIDPVFRKDRDVKVIKVLRFVKPSFVEWLLGLPHGWTDLKSLDRECIEASRASLSAITIGPLCADPHTQLLSLPLRSSLHCDCHDVVVCLLLLRLLLCFRRYRLKCHSQSCAQAFPGAAGVFAAALCVHSGSHGPKDTAVWTEIPALRAHPA